MQSFQQRREDLSHLAPLSDGITSGISRSETLPRKTSRVAQCVQREEKPAKSRFSDGRAIGMQGRTRGCASCPVTRLASDRAIKKQAYRTKSVSGPIIHSFRNGYLVLWWSSSHTRPSPHFSGREASSALMPYRSLSRSTSASVGISRSVSAIVFGHSTCR